MSISSSCGYASVLLEATLVCDQMPGLSWHILISSLLKALEPCFLTSSGEVLVRSKTMKIERVYQTHYLTNDQAKVDLFHYIEIWYTKNLIHSSIGMKSMQEFEKINKDDYFRNVV